MAGALTKGAPGRRVLVIGGTGTFGRHLVRGILRGTTLGVVVAGRRMAAARDFAAACGADYPGRDVTAVALDTRTVDAAALHATGAFALVDAAGPWQHAEPRLARAAVAAGVHYLDLADARQFVVGFGAALDAEARAAGVVALAGASSTPALSNAVLDHLVAGWQAVESVAIGISPGNRAPRGLSVVRAILSYAGRPLRIFLDGRWVDCAGWGMTTRVTVPGLGRRWLSLADTPDLDIVPARFAVRRTVLFRAGLELSILHVGLVLASLPVRIGLLRSLEPLAPLFRSAAAILEPFGSDRGAMVVEARGLDATGAPTRATWTLLAEAGDGPVIPTLPALAALRALDDGRLTTRTGAGAYVGVLSLAAIEAEFGAYRIQTSIRVERPPCAPSVFRTVLGEAAFRRLPAPLRQMHAGTRWQAARGVAQVDGPTSRVAGLVGRAFGFPRAVARLPVRVALEPLVAGERWTRWFGDRRFASVLHGTGTPGRLVERFGPFSFELAARSDEQGLDLAVLGWRLGRLPLPGRLAPVSPAREGVDDQGRFRFDVEIRLPLRLGRIVRYRGWLVPEIQPCQPRSSTSSV